MVQIRDISWVMSEMNTTYDHALWSCRDSIRSLWLVAGIFTPLLSRQVRFLSIACTVYILTTPWNSLCFFPYTPCKFQNWKPPGTLPLSSAEGEEVRRGFYKSSIPAELTFFPQILTYTPGIPTTSTTTVVAFSIDIVTDFFLSQSILFKQFKVWFQ